MFLASIAALNRTTTMIALVMVLVSVATTVSGDGSTPCPPKAEKLYTPNVSMMKAQVEKFEAFTNDMRVILSDMRILDSQDQDNHFWGRVSEVRTIAGEAGRILCSSVNSANKTLATPCKTVQSVADVANDLKACAEGHATGCVGLVLTRAKRKLKKEKSKIDAELDDLSDPRGSPFPWDRIDIETTLKGTINNAKRAGVEVAKGANKAATSDGTTEAMVAAGKAAAILKGTIAGEEASAIVGSAAKIKEAYAVGRELDEAARENQMRRTKLIQQLESRVSTVSHKIAQLRAEVYAIDWGAMGKPEPNMTPIKRGECEDSKEKEDELDRLAKEGLGEMDRVRQVAPVREPAQGNAETNGLAILGQVLGDAAALQRDVNQQRQLYKGPAGAPVSEYYRLDKGPNHQLDSQGLAGIEQQHQAGCREVVKNSQNGTSTVQIVCGGDTGSGRSMGGRSVSPLRGGSGKRGAGTSSDEAEKTPCSYGAIGYNDPKGGWTRCGN